MLCVKPELRIGMPTAHHKYEVQDCGIVWGRDEAIEHWECTLLGHQPPCPAVWRTYLLYLEKVLKVMCCQLLHLQCIVCKLTDGVFPKWGNEAESEGMEI